MSEDEKKDEECNCRHCQEHKGKLETENHFLATPDVFARVADEFRRKA